MKVYPTVDMKRIFPLYILCYLFLFFKRLYRTVMSETLVSPQQTAREMMKMMKDRQFARIFQKNELKEQVCKNLISTFLFDIYIFI